MHTDSYAGIGISHHHDSFLAGQEAALSALRDAADLPVVCIIVYGTVIYDQQELLKGVRSIIKEGPIVGGSVQGISYQDASEEIDRVVGLTVLCSNKITAKASCAREISKNPHHTGQQLASPFTPQEGEAPTPVLLWYDPLTGVNADAMLQGFADEGITHVLGGATGQPWGPMHKTYQYWNEEVLSDSAIALQLEGCQILFELTNGIEPLGLELEITSAKGNVIQSIDEQPALDAWSEQLGGDIVFEVNDAASWALGVTLPEEVAALYEGPITRAVFGFNEETREIILQAPIETGTTIQLCHRTPEAVYSRALKMAERLKHKLSGQQPILALSFECAARPAPFLGAQKALEEVQAIQDILGKEIPWFGTYAWGEIAPVGQKSYFHNYSFPLCVICT